MSNPYEERLRRFIAEHQIQAEHLSFQESCHSVAEAARAVNAAADDLVKNICVVDGEGNLIVAIVKGEDRVSLQRIGQVLGSPHPAWRRPRKFLTRPGTRVGARRRSATRRRS